MTNTLLLEIPNALWMSSNDRKDRRAVMGRVAAVRRMAEIEARNAGLTPMTQAHIAIFVGYPTRVKADPPNAWPTAKAAIDGVVDSGVLVDDSSEFVFAHSFMRDAKKSPTKHHTLRLVFTDQFLPWMTNERPEEDR